MRMSHMVVMVAELSDWYCNLWCISSRNETAWRHLPPESLSQHWGYRLAWGKSGRESDHWQRLTTNHWPRAQVGSPGANQLLMPSPRKHLAKSALMTWNGLIITMPKLVMGRRVDPQQGPSSLGPPGLISDPTDLHGFSWSTRNLMKHTLGSNLSAFTTNLRSFGHTWNEVNPSF